VDIVLSTAMGWKDKADDEAVLQASKNIIDRSVALGKEMGLHHRYIYQNYAAQHQDVFAGYGEKNRKRLREIRNKYDPEGVFSKLQPGYFKV
jgi:FAD/FMN-containing dehydrogenase